MAIGTPRLTRPRRVLVAEHRARAIRCAPLSERHLSTSVARAGLPNLPPGSGPRAGRTVDRTCRGQARKRLSEFSVRRADFQQVKPAG